jgi:hypothetical protein
MESSWLAGIGEGVSRKRALEFFVNSCNKRDTLFITDRWVTPRLEQLRKTLTDPLTAEEAQGLREVLSKRSKLDDLIEWLKDRRLSWVAFNQGKKWLAEEQKRIKEENAKLEYEKRYEASEKAWREKGRTPEEAARNDGDLQKRYSHDAAKEKYLADAKSCPKCGTHPDNLAWVSWL